MKRTVLQLISSFRQGGTERQTLQLTRLLLESGRFGVRLACLDGTGVLRAEAERLGLAGIPEFRLTSFYDLRAVRQVRRFAALLRTEKIDVVHTSDFYTNVFGMAGATLARVPVRIASKRESTGVRTEAQRRVELVAFRLAHAIVTNAEAVASQLTREGVAPRKVVTIYNGLDLARVAAPPTLQRAESMASFGLPSDVESRFVTIVANLAHPVKDHPTFLRAARRVADRVPEARFLVAGEGDLERSMRELAGALGLGDRVHFLGRCDRVAELLWLSDVCVLASKAEGFSNSILEYMAAARPVVATNVGGAAEAIVEGATGYLVSPGDDVTMADRIATLLVDRDRASEMGAEGRRVVVERFSCEAQLARTEALYERLLALA